MTVVHVDGAWVAPEDAKVSVFDRGFLFADGVYEVAAVLDGRLVDLDAHLARLERSAGEIALALPASRSELAAMLAELARRTSTTEGMVYLEVTRGAAPVRDFAFPPPSAGVAPTVVAFAQSFPIVASAKGEVGASVVTVPEVRWKRRDIKSVALLGQVLARQAAVSAGAAEAFFVDDDGTITEGAASNAYLVTKGTLVTRPLGWEILHGTTRARVLECARALGVPVAERTFTREELLAGDEAFYTGAAAFVVPAVRVDGQPIGPGVPSPVTRALRAAYIDAVRSGL
jgi:D-alanine transaminase